MLNQLHDSPVEGHCWENAVVTPGKARLRLVSFDNPATAISIQVGIVYSRCALPGRPTIPLDYLHAEKSKLVILSDSATCELHHLSIATQLLAASVII